MQEPKRACPHPTTRFVRVSARVWRYLAAATRGNQPKTRRIYMSQPDRANPMPNTSGEAIGPHPKMGKTGGQDGGQDRGKIFQYLHAVRVLGWQDDRQDEA